MTHHATLTASVLAALVATTVHAAENPEIPADSFRPALDANGTITADSGRTTGHLVLDGALLLDYVLNPLVASERTADGVTRVAALVSHRLGGNLIVSLGLSDWFQFGIDLPVALFQTRDSNVSAIDVGVAAASDFSLVGLGDLRLRPKLQVLHAKDVGVDVAILPTLSLPTHAPLGSFLGESYPTFVPEVAVSRDLGGLRLVANVGARLRGDAGLNDLSLSHELTYRGAVAYRFDTFPIALGADLVGSSALLTPFQDVNQNPLEVLGSVAWQAMPYLQASVGAGVGVIAGYGTPDLRVMTGVRYHVEDDDRDDDGINDVDDKCADLPEDKDGHDDGDGCPDPDNDGDGIADGDDKCANDAEDKDDHDDTDGCPDLDNDGDGIPDDSDRCVNEAEDKDVYDDGDGCPDPDNDGDGIKDEDDKCRNVAGLTVNGGCPDVDGDSDGIVDRLDKCPGEPETPNNVEDDDGCPDKAKAKLTITREQIEILEQVLFDTGKATIKKQSFDLLNQVAKVLVDHPELAKIRVEGHTDDTGSAKRNQRLSEDRTKSVVAYLVKAGVDAARLTSVGYGATQPQAQNDSAENRAKNRRVVFKILTE